MSLRILSNEKWYGPGYCGVCGTRGDDIVPKAVRWWDCDDGWKVGVLCVYCTEEEQDSPGPTLGDYAYDKAEHSEMVADISAMDGDMDATYTAVDDLR